MLFPLDLEHGSDLAIQEMACYYNTEGWQNGIATASNADVYRKVVGVQVSHLPLVSHL